MDAAFMKEAKRALRDAVNGAIAALSTDYIEKSNLGLFARMTTLPEYERAGTIFAFYSVAREPDTLRIIEHALSLGKTVALPICDKGGIMHAHVIERLSDAVPAMLGIPAPSRSAPRLSPEALDFIIVPALAFDRDGYRIGYGGGYYDRYLPQTKAFCAGIGRAALLQSAVLREAHDRRVSCVVTEDEVLRFDAE